MFGPQRVMAIRLGNGQRYKVLRTAMLRERADRNSPPCGSLNPGQVVMALGQLTDDQGER